MDLFLIAVVVACRTHTHPSLKEKRSRLLVAIVADQRLEHQRDQKMPPQQPAPRLLLLAAAALLPAASDVAETDGARSSSGPYIGPSLPEPYEHEGREGQRRHGRGESALVVAY